MSAVFPVITTRPATLADMPAIKDLNARVFGPGRFVRTAYRVREGTPDVSAYCRVTMAGTRLIASIRMTEALVGGEPGALLLGPLAVDPEFEGQGYARRLVAESAVAAQADGRQLIILVGDLPYYGRIGFIAVPRGQIVLPGPADPARILVKELAPDALAKYRGMVTGAPPLSNETTPRS